MRYCRHSFENDVKTYGTQALMAGLAIQSRFENDVKTYGTQASVAPLTLFHRFENDVKTYGTQATKLNYNQSVSLRMM